MSQVLLTGGNGFIGAHIVNTLLQRGYSLVTTVRSEAKTTFLRDQFASYGDKLQFAIVPDIAIPGAFDEVLQTHTFDAVLHTSSPYTFGINDIQKDMLDPAIQGTVGILDSIHRLAPSVKHVVVTSSFASVVDLGKGAGAGYVYSEKDWNPVTLESAQGNVVLGYMASKTFAEKAAYDFVKDNKTGFTITTICPPLVVGPALSEVESMSKLNTSVATLYDVFSRSSPTLSEQLAFLWVDVRDLALAHVLAIEKPEAENERFIVTAGKWSIQQFADYVWKLYPERAEAKGLPKGDLKQLYPEGGVYDCDNSKSKKLLGIEYRSFEAMVKDLLEDFVRLEKKLL